MNDNTKEYLMLREEMLMRIKEQDTISKFVITTSVVIFGYAFSNPQVSALVYLLTFIFIVPLAFKELENKRAISYLGGYIIVVLEEKIPQITWGRNYYKFRIKSYDNGVLNKITAFGNLEFFALGIISAILYTIKCIKDNVLLNVGVERYGINLTITNIVLIIGSAIIILVLFVITIQYNNYDDGLRKYVKKWMDFQLDSGQMSKKRYDELSKELLEDEERKLEYYSSKEGII
ncbi:MAG: hypothetical protein PHE02_05955 [Lachnospiraceae bacterium]|nr:hypothetical protein [Lachnospiraceae bacterium]